MSVILVLVLFIDFEHLVYNVHNVLLVWLDFLIELINSFVRSRILFSNFFHILHVFLFEVLELAVQMTADNLKTSLTFLFLHLLLNILVYKRAYTVFLGLTSRCKFSNVFLFDYR